MTKIDDDGNTFFCWSYSILMLVMVIPIAMIILGSYYIKECEMEPKIQIFMIVTGIAYIILSLFAYCAVIWGRWTLSTATKTSLCIGLFIYLFVFAWNIAGSYWVFKEWTYWDQSKDVMKDGCDKKSYLLIFSLTIIYWILFPVHLIGICWKSKRIYEDL